MNELMNDGFRCTQKGLIMHKCRIWYMMGVKGRLSREAYKGFQKICRLATEAKEDIYITSLSEGLHSMPSLHYSGMTTQESDAWDQRPFKNISLNTCRKSLGNDFDCVEEADHWHFEYDPK